LIPAKKTNKEHAPIWR